MKTIITGPKGLLSVNEDNHHGTQRIANVVVNLMHTRQKGPENDTMISANQKFNHLQETALRRASRPPTLVHHPAQNHNILQDETGDIDYLLQ
ncbi:hypothetical protein Hanom_Chr00s000005g01612041 [Helianthus anomalus]